MDYTYESLTCPTCGANITVTDTVCSCCGGTFIRKKKSIITGANVTSLINRNENLADEKGVIPYILKVVELLDGRKPFLCDRKTIDQCVRHIEIAYEDFPCGLLDYLRAYIEYDYFERKNLNRKPGYHFYLEQAKMNEISQEEISELERVLKNKINIGG